MNKQVAIKLRQLAQTIAVNFSRLDREFNYSNDKFTPKNIIPLSENTAVIIFDKSSGKQAIAFCYYISMNNGTWQYFFPTDSHILGMEKVKDYLHKIEVKNFPENFKEGEYER